jgi:hypothetical protein
MEACGNPAAEKLVEGGQMGVRLGNRPIWVTNLTVSARLRLRTVSNRFQRLLKPFAASTL